MRRLDWRRRCAIQRKIKAWLALQPNRLSIFGGNHQPPARKRFSSFQDASLKEFRVFLGKDYATVTRIERVSFARKALRWVWKMTKVIVGAILMLLAGTFSVAYTEIKFRYSIYLRLSGCIFASRDAIPFYVE